MTRNLNYNLTYALVTAILIITAPLKAIAQFAVPEMPPIPKTEAVDAQPPKDNYLWLYYDDAKNTPPGDAAVAP